MKKGSIVNMVVGDKVWHVSHKLADKTIQLAKEKYEGSNVIVAVEKDGIVTLMKDKFDTTKELIHAVEGWTKGGYKCHYTNK